jgi:hypothetical protein
MKQSNLPSTIPSSYVGDGKIPENLLKSTLLAKLEPDFSYGCPITILSL